MAGGDIRSAHGADREAPVGAAQKSARLPHDRAHDVDTGRQLELHATQPAAGSTTAGSRSGGQQNSIASAGLDAARLDVAPEIYDVGRLSARGSNRQIRGEADDAALLASVGYAQHVRR